MYLLLSMALVLLIAGVIFLLHKSQQKNRNEVADRTAPLAVLDLDFDDGRPESPASSAATPAAPITPAQAVSIDLPPPFVTHAGANAAVIAGDEGLGQDSWLDQVKRLRELDELPAALQLCQQQYPRIQAFQQAAVILRQLIRLLIEQHKPVVAEVRQLYRIAVLADLYRNSNPLKPRDPQATLNSLLTIEFEYKHIGTRLLRLLTKSDIRHLEQLWGKPLGHQHAEETLGPQWQELCR